MKNILTLIFVALLVSGACSHEKGVPANLLDRTWSKTSTNPPATFTLIFKRDSTFIFGSTMNPSSDPIRYRCDNEVLTFPASNGCAVEGKYKITVKGDELIFKTVDDQCAGRKVVIEGTWKFSKDKK
ncbi:MAG: hypothetical protein ABSB78_08875 [Bacteroidota bacterium]